MREVNNGIVVLLDALGASGYDIEACKRFIEFRDQHVTESLHSYLLGINSDISLKVNLKPETFTFGDTIIFAWDFGIETKCIPVALSFVSLWLAWFISLGLTKKILFRGAMGRGEYVSDPPSNTILGTAVVDANSWYQKTEWFGVVLTPSCGISIDRFRLTKDENNEEYIKESLIKSRSFSLLPCHSVSETERG